MNNAPLMTTIEKIRVRSQDKGLTIQQIVEIFSTEGHFLLILFLIIPFLQPIPLFGLSTPMGIIIGIVALFAYFGKSPWIPARWGNRRLEPTTIEAIAQGIIKVHKKMSFLFKPRLSMLLRGPLRAFNTLVLVVSAFLLALPLPIPFSNAMPGWVILLQALANLEEDGALILISYAQMVACIVYFFFLSEGALAIAHLIPDLVARFMTH